MDHFQRQELEDALATRILVLDGAMGSILQARLRVEDYGGAHLENCTDNVSRANPGVVYAVHTQLSGRRRRHHRDQLVQRPPGVAGRVSARSRRVRHQLRRGGARPQGGGRVFRAGPAALCRRLDGTHHAIHHRHRATSLSDLRDGYYLQARALVEGGADVLLLETCQDTRNVKAALLAIDELERELGMEIPVMVSGTIEPMGTMLAGQTAEAFCASIAHANLLSVGLNCATGPEFMTDHIRTLHEMAPTRVSCYPNAGLPNEERQVSRDAGVAGRAARTIRRPRLAQHRRRLLRHHAGAHHARSRRWSKGKRPRPVPGAVAPRLLLRHRPGRGRGEPTGR